MKTRLLLSLFTASICFAQSGPYPPNPHGVPGVNVPDPRTLMLSPEEIVKVRQLLDTYYPPPLVGQTLPPKMRSRKGGQTIAVFMSSTCPHCSTEVPFLSKLDGLAKDTVVPVFFDKDDGASNFLTSRGWKASPIMVTATDMGAIRVRGTPTTIVADASGKITAAYTGELTADQKATLETLAVALDSLSSVVDIAKGTKQ